MDPARPRPDSPLAPLQAWLRAPRLTWCFLALLAALLALRKPWALSTPQLWAEDGSIFLMQADWHGLGSFTIPYMGYLHTLPRLVAWVASHTLDPRWWPGCYNGVAFVVSLGVVARLFSPRLALPGAPWLALAFFLGPQTGEVLINLTNLQWFTGFLLVQQALIARPANAAQRVGDAVIVLLAGLTGPFVAAFWPLFAWRWWREKNWDTAAALLLATACAAVQGWFVVHTGPKFTFPPFAAARFFEIIGQHLLVWPVVGDALAIRAPHLLLSLGGLLPVAVLLAWALRPHPRRLLRAQIVVAFLLITAATVYRSRPDTWSIDNLWFGERYFFIPRILLAWLLVWEFDAAPRAVAWLARGLLLAVALVHLRHFAVPAPPDYHWAEHCEPIRRGVEAKIPTLPEGWTLEQARTALRVRSLYDSY